MTAGRPSLTFRRRLSGVFVDFDLLPDLLSLAAAGNLSREEATEDWSRHLFQHGISHAHIDQDVSDSGDVLVAVSADAWRFCERMGLIGTDGVTPEGRRLVAMAASGKGTDLREAISGVLRRGVVREMAAQGETDALPFLRAGARKLASTTNLWARCCPGLIPVEVTSMIHWASVDAERVQRLLSDLVTWRDVAMHAYEDPDECAEPGLNADRHFEAVSAFYLSHPWLAERVPLSFAEEVATCRLLAYCGLLRLVDAERGSTCWLIENDSSAGGDVC